MLVSGTMTSVLVQLASFVSLLAILAVQPTLVRATHLSRSLSRLNQHSCKQLHAPISDKRFWNEDSWLLSENDATWPQDAVKERYVGNWAYHYREVTAVYFLQSIIYRITNIEYSRL